MKELFNQIELLKKAQSQAKQEILAAVSINNGELRNNNGNLYNHITTTRNDVTQIINNDNTLLPKVSDTGSRPGLATSDTLIDMGASPVTENDHTKCKWEKHSESLDTMKQDLSTMKEDFSDQVDMITTQTDIIKDINFLAKIPP